jgi:hypothetical protein
MQEPYTEGPAIHGGPESCAGAREGDGEALTGVRMGAVSSREIRQSRAPTLLSEAEGHTISTAIARGRSALRGRRPAARAEPFCARTGRSQARPLRMAQWAAPGRPMAGSR